MGEVENIGPGTSRDFTVDLGAGTYEVACKPGQTGDGIRTEITVTGTATTVAAADRTVAFESLRPRLHRPRRLSTVTAGETIEFAMTNTATDRAARVRGARPRRQRPRRDRPHRPRPDRHRGAHLRRRRQLHVRVRHHRPRGQGHEAAPSPSRPA